MNRELPDVWVGFRKGRGTRVQIANFYWIIEKAREFQKNIYFYFIDYAKAFDCVYHNKLWKILKEIGIPDHLTCLLRNLLYAGQEATVWNGHGTMDWFKIGKGVQQGCILSPYLFNLYAEYHVKCWADWIISWNQVCQEKYQQPQICRWHHSIGRKWRTRKPLDEGERTEWKNWLKTQHSKNLKKLRS